ncbi:MAG: nitroreductase family deazaflavin-dependent oxidoreductase [Actinomycetota bacterium]|nr:nitroreductase family deazaflavin-dependent oxidoreductase [Actinomycetota bacterium]
MKRLLQWSARLTALVLVVGSAFGAVFVVGMRTKSPRVQRAVRQMNKRFWNPRALETAGSPGASASVVRHTGRRSGTAYETPVVAVPADDGFVIVLPYSTNADWVRNVLAAGRATILHEGGTHEVDRPEIVPIDEVADALGDSNLAHRTFGVTECLRLHRVEPVAPAART